MLPYIILISTAGVLSLICFNKYNKNNSQSVLKITFLSASFLLLFIYSALRIRIGYDYLMYSQGFFRMGIDGFSTLIYKDWEWGFNILTKIIVFFTRDVRIYMAIIAIICLAGPFYAIYRYSKNVWLSVLLYINLYFFYCTMNFLRQSIAISIVLFAYTFLVNRKFFRYILLILFAAAFHSTVLIMLPVYFLINFKPSLKTPLLYAYLILWVYISSKATLDIITDYIHGEYKESVFFASGIDPVQLVIPTLILCSGIYLMRKFINPKKNTEDTEDTENIDNRDRIVIIQTNLMYFSYFWLSIMLRHAIFERFSYYTYIFVILYIPELITFIDVKYKEYIKKRFYNIMIKKKLSEIQQEKIFDYYMNKKKRLIVLLTALIVIITLSNNIYGLLAYDKGIHGVYPYISWF